MLCNIQKKTVFTKNGLWLPQPRIENSITGLGKSDKFLSCPKIITIELTFIFLIYKRSLFSF